MTRSGGGGGGNGEFGILKRLRPRKLKALVYLCLSAGEGGGVHKVGQGAARRDGLPGGTPEGHEPPAGTPESYELQAITQESPPGDPPESQVDWL